MLKSIIQLTNRRFLIWNNIVSVEPTPFEPGAVDAVYAGGKRELIKGEDARLLIEWLEEQVGIEKATATLSEIHDEVQSIVNCLDDIASSIRSISDHQEV